MEQTTWEPKRVVTDGGETDFSFEKVWEHRATPTADGERFSVLLDDVWVLVNFNGVTALERDTGEERWIYAETTDFANLYAGGGYAYVVPEDEEELLALDLADGSVAWRTDYDRGGSKIFPGSATEDGLLVTDNSGTHVFDHAGEELLHIDDGERGLFLGTTDDHVVVHGGFGPTVYDRTDGDKLAEVDSGEAVAVVDDTLVGTTADGIAGYDLPTGEREWELDVDVDLEPAGTSTGEGYLAVLHSEFDADDVVFVLDVETGDLVWQRDVEIVSPFTPEIVAGAVVMDVHDGVVAADLATGEELAVLEEDYTAGMNSALAVESDESTFYLSSDPAIRRYDI